MRTTAKTLLTILTVLAIVAGMGVVGNNDIENIKHEQALTEIRGY